MSSLYQLDSEWTELQRMIEDGDTTQEEMADHLEAMDIEFEQKAHAIGCVLRNLEAEGAAIELECGRLDDRRNGLVKERQKLSDYLLASMQKREQKKVKTPLFTFSYRAPSKVAVIDDEATIPPEYFTVIPETTRLNKKALLADLKSGDVKGAHLGEGKTNLQIK